MPPRACARPADRSSSAATCSSDPGAAAARCHARRSGSRSRSVTSASARCAARRSSSDAAEYAADRTSGCRNRTRPLVSSNPSARAAFAAEAGMPSRPAARHTSTGSPAGSAAAMSISDRVSAGSAASRRRKPSSIRAGTGCAPASPNPPVSWAGSSPRGSSSRASGLPFVSARIRSRTCSSSRNRTTEPSSVRASWSGRPRTSRSASPPNCSPGSRAAKISPTGSASSRRAANASTCADAWSSHCASSTTHNSGRSSATSASNVSTASPTRNRSGAAPARSPNAISSASRCGPGRPSVRSSSGAHSTCKLANASSISDSTPTARATRISAAAPTTYSSSADLPTPASPRTTSARPHPDRRPSSRPSSAARSRCRSSSAGTGSDRVRMPHLRGNLATAHRHGQVSRPLPLP